MNTCFSIRKWFIIKYHSTAKKSKQSSVLDFWDLRRLKSCKPLKFQYSRKPIVAFDLHRFLVVNCAV